MPPEDWEGMADMKKTQAIREAMVEAYRELGALGLNVGASGNISLRFSGGTMITPTGCTAETLRPKDIVLCDFDGKTTGPLAPSSEWAMHAEVYARVPDAQAVVHTHSDYCVALASHKKPIPAFHYMVQSFDGKDVPCVPYYPFGTRKLGAAAGKALETRTACLMANHGMLARGRTLHEAFETAVRLETITRQYVLALSIGQPMVLTDRQMGVVAKQFEDYGRQPRAKVKARWQVP
jgi:L-fuculose-phosphate aldolase